MALQDQMKSVRTETKGQLIWNRTLYLAKEQQIPSLNDHLSLSHISFPNIQEGQNIE